MKFLTGFLFLTAWAAAQTTPLPADPNNVMRVETDVVLVDAVVTDKKGNYIHDLKQKDFKVWEDNKEQTIKSFSFEADPESPLNAQPRYLVLFFDNSTMNFGDQALARRAAVSFIDSNAGPNRKIAIVNYSGGLQIAQDFTSDVERLKAIASGVKTPYGPAPNGSGLGRVAGDFGARNMILGIRSLAKGLASIPGRKTLVLLTAGFALRADLYSDVTATIDVCNRSNVAIYPIDVRGLVATPHASIQVPASPFRYVVYEQPPKGGSGSTGGKGTAGSGTSRSSSGTSGAAPRSSAPSAAGGGGGRAAPTVAPRPLAPRIPPSATTNQQLMYMLADGTGGFVILNTNDLLGGMEKIGKEMNEFYLIGYTPAERGNSREMCHWIRVRVDRGGASVRARTGYCNVKLHDVLAQTPAEKTLEVRAQAAQAGTIAATMEAPYFFTGSNVARVNVAMEIPAQSLKFSKEKGKLVATINVLGIAYKPDGSVGARFSDSVPLEFENEKEVEAFQERPFHYENQFDVAAGQYTLKVVFSAGSQDFGKVEQPLLVDAYDLKKFSVSALALSSRFIKTGEVNESLETALLEDRTPLIAQGYQVIPSGTAAFRKTGKTALYFEIYEPGLLDAEPAKGLMVGIQVRVFDQKGALKFDTHGFRIPLPEKGGNPALPFAIQLPVATFDPGSFKVVLDAVDSANNKFQRTANFEVQQ